MNHFFPELAFAWSFFCVLVVLLGIAAVVDLRTTRIPKTLTITLAITGLVANVVRGYWLGSQDQNGEVWVLGAGGPWLGALDGALFSLSGLLFAFALFTGMWLLGSCGGGDVKLFAGIGAWIGAKITIFLLFATVVALLCWVCVSLLVGGLPQKKPAHGHKTKAGKHKQPTTAPGRRMTFSLPATVAAAAVMVYFFWTELHL